MTQIQCMTGTHCFWRRPASRWELLPGLFAARGGQTSAAQRQTRYSPPFLVFGSSLRCQFAAVSTGLPLVSAGAVPSYSGGPTQRCGWRCSCGSVRLCPSALESRVDCLISWHACLSACTHDPPHNLTWAACGYSYRTFWILASATWWSARYRMAVGGS